MNKTEFIQNLPFFQHLNFETIQELTDLVEQRVFKKHEIVFREGDEADGMYVIILGEVEVAIGMEVVASLTIGDFFGEIALITSENRMGSVGVVSDTCSTLFLSKEAFSKIKYKMTPADQAKVLERIESAIK